jgi:3-oxoacyl-[acyl-carrier protein] reductase
MAQDTGRLDGKVAIVTGAGMGIGRAIAIAYGKAGAAVTCAARTLKDIENTVQEIESQGGRGLAMKTDVTQTESVQQMVEATVDRFGGIDILVVNAGGNYAQGPVEEVAPSDWLATLELNLVGAYYCARAVIPHQKRRGAGKIITVGSGIGHRGHPGISAYACAKAGLWMLTRVLAQELWEHNISVNELVPGPVMTVSTSCGGMGESTPLRLTAA